MNGLGTELIERWYLYRIAEITMIVRLYQENSEDRIKKAIDQRTDELKREIPKILWD